MAEVQLGQMASERANNADVNRAQWSYGHVNYRRQPPDDGHAWWGECARHEAIDGGAR